MLVNGNGKENNGLDCLTPADNPIDPPAENPELTNKIAALKEERPLSNDPQYQYILRENEEAIEAAALKAQAEQALIYKRFAEALYAAGSSALGVPSSLNTSMRWLVAIEAQGGLRVFNNGQGSGDAVNVPHPRNQEILDAGIESSLRTIASAEEGIPLAAKHPRRARWGRPPASLGPWRSYSIYKNR